MQMYYLKQIVESDFNLTLAAKQLHVSQPALSRFVLNFEEKNKILIFERKYNRLVGLTPIGSDILNAIDDILERYEDLESIISKKTNELADETISIGATITTPQVLLPGFFAQLSKSYPHLHINLIEGGSLEINRRFLNQEFTFALIVDPFDHPHNFSETRLVYTDQIAAFVNPSHPLVKQEEVTWQEVAKYPLMTLSDDYITYHKVISKFKDYDLHPEFVFVSTSWHYLMDSVQNFPNAIMLLPECSPRLTVNEDMVSIPIRDSADFPVYLAKLCKKRYTQGEKLLDKVLLEVLPREEA